VLRVHSASGQFRGFCFLNDPLQVRAFIFSTFVTDLVLLALMLVGVLRWRMAGEMGGIWWVLFAQVSIPSYTAATVFA
jgi:hypothetical protein